MFTINQQEVHHGKVKGNDGQGGVAHPVCWIEARRWEGFEGKLCFTRPACGRKERILKSGREQQHHAWRSANRALAGRRVQVDCGAMGKKSRRRRKAVVSGPYSGQILGAVVDTLGVGDGVLADKTAKRMFAGRSVSERSRKERLEALGQELVGLGVVPDVDWQAREAGFREDLKSSDVLADVIGLMCEWWDMLMERVQSESVQLADVGQAVRQFLRLVTVDVSLRMLGWAYLAEVELPELHMPLWAQPNGAGEILRNLLREADLRRHQLARELEVSPTTVDNWLGGNNFPSWFYLRTLAEKLSQGQGISAEDLEARLRRELALARLADAVASVVGWDDVAADLEAAFRFARLMQETDALASVFEWVAEVAEFAGSDLSEKPDFVGGYLALLLVRMGSDVPFARRLFWALARQPEVSDWSDDIYAVASSIELQLRHIAGNQSGGRTAAGLAQDYFDVVVEPTPEDLEANEAIRTTLVGENNDVFPFRLEMSEVVSPFAAIERSIRIRRGLVRRFPRSAEAHYQLGSMLGMMGRRVRNRAWVDEGIMECRVAAGLEPRWDAPAVEPGVIMCNIGDWDGALRELEVAKVRCWGKRRTYGTSGVTRS